MSCIQGTVRHYTALELFFKMEENNRLFLFSVDNELFENWTLQVKYVMLEQVQWSVDEKYC